MNGSSVCSCSIACRLLRPSSHAPLKEATDQWKHNDADDGPGRDVSEVEGPAESAALRDE